MRNKFADLVGHRFGKLLVLRDGWFPGCGEAKWICRCDCGNQTEVKGSFLRRGKVKSCGCWLREFARVHDESTLQRRRMLAGAKYHAKKRGMAFDLEIADIVIPETCPVLGIPLFRSGDARAPNTPSLDRILNDVGYIRGNVAVISWRANQLKRDASPAEVAALAAWIASVVK